MKYCWGKSDVKIAESRARRNRPSHLRSKHKIGFPSHTCKNLWFRNASQSRQPHVVRTEAFHYKIGISLSFSLFRLLRQLLGINKQQGGWRCLSPPLSSQLCVSNCHCTLQGSCEELQRVGDSQFSKGALTVPETSSSISSNQARILRCNHIFCHGWPILMNPK